MQTLDRGEKSEFGDFVEANFTTAYRFAFCLSLAHDRATRLVETTFQEADQLRKSDENTAVDRAWILKTLHRKWRACHPSRFDSDVEERDDDGKGALIEIEDVANMECDTVLKILHSMSPAHRFVLSLFYFEQLGYNEIARILEVPAETVVSHLSKAKVLLRQMLEQTHRKSLGHEIGADRSG